ncbi:hypothetical protein MMYC01_203190 [Madurella mycetomatis]|uniref:Uncharacterized protein n=1 Tax=Madurella mycetomatis TaxID=100816 RepID=A0A175WCJ8_9PEZI|nr:hypothetical protein MMYC01_203190 [Madurella mycetomatis]
MVSLRTILALQLASLAVALPTAEPPHDGLTKRSALRPHCESVQAAGFYAVLQIQSFASQAVGDAETTYQQLLDDYTWSLTRLNDICFSLDYWLDHPGTTYAEAEQNNCQRFGGC